MRTEECNAITARIVLRGRDSTRNNSNCIRLKKHDDGTCDANGKALVEDAKDPPFVVVCNLCKEIEKERARENDWKGV